MAEKDEPIDDLPAVNRTWTANPPAEVPVDRLDYGDAAQRAEMAGLEEFVPPDEPVEMVDAPIQIRGPYSRAEKRRNQRPLPT